MINDKARLSLFLPSLHGGGAQRVMVLLANGFASWGHQVDLVLSKAEGPFLDDVSEKVRIVDLGASRVITSLPGLARYLRRERPEVMLSAIRLANVAALAAQSVAGVGIRIVVSEHTNFSISKKNERTFRRRLVGRSLPWLYPRADGVIAVSAGVADDLAPNVGMSRKSIDVIHNPVVTDEVPTLASARTGHPWFEKGEPPVLLGVGRLEKPKDFATLIRAFKKLRESHEVRLMILGEGTLLGELHSLTEELDLDSEVSFPGFVDNPYSFMRSSSLFVLSSAWEGFGNVLVEAMACGTPVVSTACPSGPNEILEDGKWGRLVPVGDVEALAEAMRATLDEVEHPDVVARAADFSVDRAVEGYVDVMLPASK